MVLPACPPSYNTEGRRALENDAIGDLKLGWSGFARDRYVPGGEHTWFAGTHDELLDRVRAAWPRRQPGQGRADRSQVVVVPVAPDGFVCGTVLVTEDTPLHADLVRRQDHEDPYIRVTADGPRETARHAAVVLYSAATLLENGGARSGDFDWEVVALLASPTADEPMDPLTMARNMLAKPGGTPCDYTAREFAEAVWYWSRRAAAKG
jgi:hypothetical protein